MTANKHMPVDVLAVIDDAATWVGPDTAALHEARAAVAELIEAADEVLYELRDKCEAKSALIAALKKARGK